MKFLRTLRNYLCYCGIEKEEYNEVKIAAYVSNVRIWRVLHCAMIAIFAVLTFLTVVDDMVAPYTALFVGYLLYSLVATFSFFSLESDTILAQFWIYLSISLLLLFGAFVTRVHVQYPATTFIVLLLVLPMFMIDKPYFMGLVLGIAVAVFLVWMYHIKPYFVWRMDVLNTGVFAAVGFFLHVISNSIRIKEFTLTRKINIQKDTDDLTGLRNKGALTREINAYLADETENKGILFILDFDRFKAINDTYGHDVGDDVIRQFGDYLRTVFTGDEIVGRFGGDEFVFFVKGTNDEAAADRIAQTLLSGAPEHGKLPDETLTFGASIGVALYRGAEKNYSELFKKADTALYEVKSDPERKYKIYEES